MATRSAPAPAPFATSLPALRVAAGWSMAVVIAVGVVAWTTLGLPAVSVATAATVTAVAAALMLYGLGRGQATTGFAPCNRVTLVRAGVVGLLAGVLVAPQALAALGWTVLSLALAALVLDGLDGWLARRQGTESAFGARFDMEVDAALIAVLAGLAWTGGKAGVWVLALGLMRYAFVAAARVWPWLGAPLPHSLRRKAVCVLQVSVLAALMAPVLGPAMTVPMAAVALAALSWSFAVDVVWLWRHRPRVAVASASAPAAGARP